MKLICPDCGSQYDTGKFCMQCGGKLQEVVPELVCPSCGYKAKSGKFCPECGTKLTEQFASPTTVQSDQSVERKFNEKDERFAKYYGKKGFPRTIPQEERAIAIEELTPYAEQNIAEAQMLLGGILMESKDHDSQMKGIELIKKAEKSGDKLAYYLRAFVFLFDEGAKQDLDEAEKRMLECYQEYGDEEVAAILAKLYSLYPDKCDYKKAFEYATIAAENDDKDGYQTLGYLYLNGFGVKKDYNLALDNYKMAAALGDETSLNQIGIIYMGSDDFESNPEQTFYWFKEAAKKGVDMGLYNLGYCYKNGIGVTEDNEKAAECFKKAAELGNADAMCELGGYYRFVLFDPSKAKMWYQKAADLGHVDAINELGDCYAVGFGVAEDAEKAVEYYKKAADLGKIDALLGVGVICENKGDFADAVTYYTQAAEKGVPYAYLNLGKCYLEGKGFTQDLAKAEELINKAEELGVEASEIKEELLDRQEGEQNTYANALLSEGKNDEALAIYKKLAENGNVIGQSNYGNCLLNGWGTQQNMSEGIMWLEKAANQNNAWSCLRLAEVYLGLDYNDNSVTPDQEKVKEYLDKALKNGADKEEVNHIESMSIPSVEISNLVVNKDEDGATTGIQVVFKMEASALKGHRLSICAYSFGENDNIDDLSRPAMSAYLPVCNKYVEIVEPMYSHTIWNEYNLFIPYYHLSATKGTVVKTLILMIWDITNQKPELLASEELPYKISCVTHTFRPYEWVFMLLPPDPSKKLIKIPIKGKSKN